MDEKVAPIAANSDRTLAGPGRRLVLNPWKTSMKTRGSIISTIPFLKSTERLRVSNDWNISGKNRPLLLFIYPVRIIVPPGNIKSDGL